MADIYFEEGYGRLYERIENGKCETFTFHNDLGTVRHMYIKRVIPFQTEGAAYYDLVTPYGYGGPIITNCRENDKKQLAEDFKIAFQHYCEQNQIVSEFVRFHPLLGNAHDFINCYDVIHLRNTVGTNLKDYADPVQEEYSRSKRKSIRQALDAGVKFTVRQAPASLEKFKELYYSTMDRNQATDYYYFDDVYFDSLLERFSSNLLLTEVSYENQIIGMSLNFIHGKTIHIHLSGTLREYYYLSPAFVLRYALVMWGKENGMDLIHEGGGRTNAPDDSLYLFKKQFGKNTSFKFHIGRQIWNEEVYQHLCQEAGATLHADFFPAYRSITPHEFKNA